MEDRPFALVLIFSLILFCANRVDADPFASQELAHRAMERRAVETDSQGVNMSLDSLIDIRIGSHLKIKL